MPINTRESGWKEQCHNSTFQVFRTRMIEISKISKNLILVSMVSTVLVFMLGARYISDAHTRFSGVSQLQRSVTPETLLFQIADAAAVERAEIQRVLVSAQNDADVRERLGKLLRNTKTLFDQARDEILLARAEVPDNIQQRYTQEAIESLIAEIEDKFKRQRLTRSVIFGQILRATEDRSESVRMQLFDANVNLVETLNKLRVATQAYPENDYIDVLAAHDIKNAFWTLSESINQTSTLLEAFLLKYKTMGLNNQNIGNLSLRTTQHHERAISALQILEEMESNEAISDAYSDAVTLLKTQYNDVYRKNIKRLILSDPKSIDTELRLAEWLKNSNSIKQNVRSLESIILDNTLSQADKIKQRALLSLIINSFFVLACMGMAFATYRISKKIQHQANHDELTGLPNRRYFNAVLKTLFARAEASSNEKLVLITLDLNGFKTINDNIGHAAGDILLTEVAKRLSSLTRDSITIARMGGDEFAVAYSAHIDDDIDEFSSELIKLFHRPFMLEDGEVNIGASVGYSTYPKDARCIEELQTTSDFAMFRAKQSGMNAVQPYDQEIAKRYENRMAIEKDLSTAIDKGDLELYYQPQFSLKLNKANAVEALIRWNHPTRGMIPPDEFIGIAEETGLMPAIGQWVLNEACRQAAIWNSDKTDEIRVAVNVSVHQITQSEFVQQVIDTIERHGISPNLLELEITESVVIADINWVAASLGKLKDYGCHIALDDFGTGYSSLSQLQKLPLNTLKIDRSFINTLSEDSETMKSVTATITSIADIFDLETVAEGIETVDQIVEVNKLGIDVAQGYYYSKPVPVDQVLDVIESINSAVDSDRNAA